MGSPQAVLTVGFGSWGSTGDVITLGFGTGAVSATLVGAWSSVIPCNLSQSRIDAAQGAGRVLASITQGRIGAETGAERVACRTGGRIEVEE
jgi:hypothetical protein